MKILWKLCRIFYITIYAADAVAENGEKMVNVLIIDSGVSRHCLLEDKVIKTTGYENQNMLTDIIDTAGHGTAITCLISKQVRNINIYILKLFNDFNECDLGKLIDALDFISQKNIYDVINMSFGIVECNNNRQIIELENKCQVLSGQGSILVAAFDNDGAISYPAYFECVLGVESSDKVHKRNEYEYVNGSCVNIMAYGAEQKVAWINPSYTIISGNSFACANTTNVILKLLEEGCKKNDIRDRLIANAISIRNFDKYCSPLKRPTWISGMKALVLPFSKEIHSLLAFEELLDFEIIDVYDIKYRAQVGKNIASIIKYRDVKSRVIKNYSDINWCSADFNSVIVGHMEELSNICKKNILEEIIKQCNLYNKKIYAFDDLSKYYKDIPLLKENSYYPCITSKNIPKGRFGKLHNINIPVLAIIGTSSSQGKYTVQLLLREKLKNAGYSVGQIGSEPTAYCFNMDFIFPYGYSSTTYTSGYPNILILNQAIHEIDIEENDICIIGTQANTAFYGNNNLENIPLNQLEVLFGAMPDAFCIVVNPHDDIDYILRTIKGSEYIIESKCLAVIIYPIMKKTILGSLYRNENIAHSDMYKNFEKKITESLDIPVLDMLDVLTTNVLLDIVLKYFQSR